MECDPFHDAILRLDRTARAFFEGHFFTKAFLDTKRQIARRIYDFIRNRAFERMFSSRENKLDMYEAMSKGSIVLVNTSKTMLKSAASALFGRTMIALTLRAAFERVAIPPEQRRPAFLIIDEAADYLDANVDALLTQVRKYKLGLVFAHQYLDQLDGPPARLLRRQHRNQARGLRVRQGCARTRTRYALQAGVSSPRSASTRSTRRLRLSSAMLRWRLCRFRCRWGRWIDCRG
jgi:hypothetical protein